MTGVLHLDTEEFPSLLYETGQITSHSRKTGASILLTSNFRYDLLHQRLPHLSIGIDDLNAWHPWTYVTLFLLLGGNMKGWLCSWLPTILLELNGRVGTTLITFTHARLTNVCTELRYRNMLLPIHATLSEHLKNARHTFPCLLLLKQYFKGCLESNASIFVSLLLYKGRPHWHSG